MTTDWTTETKGIGEYAEVNGINLYYETHGAGRPMILLHGGLGSGEMFGPTLPALAEHHQVILVDLQGHGRTADIDRPIDIRLMAGHRRLFARRRRRAPHCGEVSAEGGQARQRLGKHPARRHST
jgi:pimeloyl-ACP methyl ester carboxylesterase